MQRGNVGTRKAGMEYVEDRQTTMSQPLALTASITCIIYVERRAITYSIVYKYIIRTHNSNNLL